MTKPLSDMTLEELWHLFPIFLVPPKEEWKEWYQEEEQVLLRLFSKGEISSISHIGSTAIPDTWAKNIVDILLEVPETADVQSVKTQLLDAGYLLMSEDGNQCPSIRVIQKLVLPRKFFIFTYVIRVTMMNFILEIT